MSGIELEPLTRVLGARVRSVDLAAPLERGRALIGAIDEHCVQRRYVYAHEWREDDLVMWDNRCVLHRGRPHDPRARRVMHRTTVAGDGSSLDEDA